MKQIKIAALAGLMMCASGASASVNKQGKVFVDLSAPFTSDYNYSSEDVRKHLPEEVKKSLRSKVLKGDDSDSINYGVGLGYYLTNDLSVTVNYSDGIELEDFAKHLFSSQKYTFDLNMLSLTADYNAWQINPDVNLFLKGGVSRFNIKAHSNDKDVKSFSINKTQFHVGTGVNWDLSDHWSAKLGYTHYDFLSMNRVYLDVEYRF